MKQYEYKDDGGRVLCKSHHMLRCSECAHVDDLEQDLNKSLEVSYQFEGRIHDLTEQNNQYQESIKLALNHIHAGNFTLATVELNKALLKEVEQ